MTDDELIRTYANLPDDAEIVANPDHVAALRRVFKAGKESTKPRYKITPLDGAGNPLEGQAPVVNTPRDIWGTYTWTNIVKSATKSAQILSVALPRMTGKTYPNREIDFRKRVR